jgi:hypothetical protein
LNKFFETQTPLVPKIGLKTYFGKQTEPGMTKPETTKPVTTKCGTTEPGMTFPECDKPGKRQNLADFKYI